MANIYFVSILVPIWNAIGQKFDFKQMLPKLLRDPTLLPPFEGEVPPESCVVVGYTVNTFTKAKDHMKSVSFNVHFVIVLGTPST
jgi:hypothetical protein